MALEKNPINKEAEELLKGKKVEKVEMRTEQPEKIENPNEVAEDYIQKLKKEGMGGPVELRQEAPSEFAEQRQEIVNTSTEMIEAIKTKKGISLPEAGSVKRSTLEALASLKKRSRPKAAESDVWSQTGGRAEKIAM